MNDTTAIDSVTRRRGIGHVGTAAHGLLGLRLLIWVKVTGLGWQAAALGLLALPVAITAAFLARARDATPLRLHGPEGHLVNCDVAVAA
jgi:hypothetical protein